MTKRQPLDVLRRLNELHLLECRMEAGVRRDAVSRSTELCERQDGFLGYLGERLASGLSDGGWVLDYRMESERFERALHDRARLASGLAQDEALLLQSVRECLDLERRNKTLKRALMARQAQSDRLDDQRRLRELDELWSQGRGAA